MYKVKCEICGQMITKCNLSKHIRAHQKGTICLKRDLTCCFCGKECKNSLSRSKHESLCPQNPNRVTTFNKKGKCAWNKGLTQETNPKIKQMVEHRKETLRIKPVRKWHQSEETKQKLSRIAKENGYGGNTHKKCYPYEHNGELLHLDSSYELLIAKDLDHNEVKWERGKRFTYHSPDGNSHKYTPDFYLPDYDVYLDPKNDFLINYKNPALGYKDIDKITWVEKQHNIMVIILNYKELSWNVIKEKIKSRGRPTDRT